MLILGIETSCDETSASVIEDGRRVLSNVIATSLKDHEAFGGVFPEVAARRQLEFILPVIDQALNEAHVKKEDIDAIAVTKGPGLLTSLLVGTSAARMLASVLHTPLIGVHHILGHLSSVWLEEEEEIPFPNLSVSVSGGHSELWLRENHTMGTIIGKTRDDAAGEAFDKGATLLGLSYPGGPALARLAEGGNPHFAEFPRPLVKEETCDMSFSGLKTSLKYYLRDRGGIEALSEIEKKDVAASYQDAICRHLVSRIDRAVSLHSEIREIHLVGGVSANQRLQILLSSFGEKSGLRIRMPRRMSYCTDNAAMIGAAGYFLFQELGEKAYAPFQTLASVPLVS